MRATINLEECRFSRQYRIWLFLPDLAFVRTLFGFFSVIVSGNPVSFMAFTTYSGYLFSIKIDVNFPVSVADVVLKRMKRALWTRDRSRPVFTLRGRNSCHEIYCPVNVSFL